MTAKFYVHAFDGRVRVYSERHGTSRAIPKDDFVDYLSKNLHLFDSEFRLLFTENNAEILMWLLEHQLRGKVGCPHFVKDVDKNWLAALLSNECSIQKNLWTCVDSVASPLYQVASAMKAIAYGKQPMLTCHPVNMAVMFLPRPKIPHAVERLVTAIGDVQWFRQVARHNRSNLSSYFGLRTSQVNAYIDGIRTPVTTRLATLVSAWYQKDADLDWPRNFLMREVKGLNFKAAIIHGSKRLLTFLQLLWDQQSHVELEFNPARFFKRQDEIDAWNYHVGKTC